MTTLRVKRALVIMLAALNLLWVPPAHANVMGLYWCDRSTVRVWDGTGQWRWKIAQAVHGWDNLGTKIRVYNTADPARAQIKVVHKELPWPNMATSQIAFYWNGSRNCIAGTAWVYLDPSFRYNANAGRVSSHEIGHTLGLDHNTYSASSVMYVGANPVWLGHPNWYDDRELTRAYGSR